MQHRFLLKDQRSSKCSNVRSSIVDDTRAAVADTHILHTTFGYVPRTTFGEIRYVPGPTIQGRRYGGGLLLHMWHELARGPVGGRVNTFLRWGERAEVSWGHVEGEHAGACRGGRVERGSGRTVETVETDLRGRLTGKRPDGDE